MPAFTWKISLCFRSFADTASAKRCWREWRRGPRSKAACGWQWDVLDWNQTAIDFYQGLGAQFLDEWRIMRVNDQAIGSLAKLAEEPAH